MRSLVRRAAALLGIAALLFTQLAVSAYACPGDEATQASDATVSMAGCDEMGAAPSPLCHPHCTQGQQSLDKPEVPNPPPAVFIGFASWPALADAATDISLAPLDACADPPPEPPLAIRNCCFRL